MLWVGDITVCQIPPLKVFKINYVKHIDMKPLTGIEKARKVGLNPDNTDMRFICIFLTNIVTIMGKLEGIVTLSAADRMFFSFADFVRMHISNGQVWCGKSDVSWLLLK
jgi:hypothetical protein